MPNPALFGGAPKGPLTTTTNEAGGRAYERSDKEALAQLALTSCFNGVYYDSAEGQLDKVKALAAKADPMFLAKLAVFARQHGGMKDAPAVLLTILSKKDPTLYRAAFPLVCDNGKVMRGHAQMMRSGLVRKSFGNAAKDMFGQWFHRSSWSIFKQSSGQGMSMADVIRLTHPKPWTPGHDALFAYLLGKKLTPEQFFKLPPDLQNYEAFKKDPLSVPMPDVPFEFLTSMPLAPAHWKQIALNMTWHQLRQGLNMLAKNKVFEDHVVAHHVAEKLRNPEEIARVKVFPYQIMQTYLATKDNHAIPRAVVDALHDALEIATSNVPDFGGAVAVGVDTSGSMAHPITGHRVGATSQTKCIDVAALIASTILRRNAVAAVIPFAEDVKRLRLEPRDTVMTNAQKLAAMGGGGTDCSAPLRFMNGAGAKADLVVMVSDSESWKEVADPARQGVSLFLPQQYANRRSNMMAEWQAFKRRNPNAKLVCIDLQPYTTSQVAPDKDILLIGGWSDRAFEVIRSFVSGELGSLVEAVEKITFDTPVAPPVLTEEPS
jgi:60 kDa SS-A/Ro ribonucleoprotein